MNTSPPAATEGTDLKKLVVELMAYCRQAQAIVAQYEQGNCFSSEFLGINQPNIRQNWHKLYRRTDAVDERGEEDLIKAWIDLVRSHTMVHYDGLLTLAEQVRYCEQNNIAGAYVETGCCRGGAAALMAKACLHYGSGPRPIHLFDSFEGLPQPDAAKDTDDWIAKEWGIPLDQQQGKMVSTGALLAAETDVRNIFGTVGYPSSHLNLYKGWFCDTIPPAAPGIGKIAILRLDGDLYSSTWDSLTGLYAQVVDGGIIIIDDYGLEGARKAVHDFLDTLPRRPYISRADVAGGYFIKQG